MVVVRQHGIELMLAALSGGQGISQDHCVQRPLLEGRHIFSESNFSDWICFGLVTAREFRSGLGAWFVEFSFHRGIGIGKWKVLLFGEC